MLSTGTTLSARAQALVPALVTLLVVATLSPFADVILPRLPFMIAFVLAGVMMWQFLRGSSTHYAWRK